MVDKSERFSLKDHLFNKDWIGYLSKLLKEVYPKLDEKKFKEDILWRFPELELKERITWIRKQIEIHFPNDYELTLKLLLKSISAKTNEENFIYSPFCDYVAANWKTKEHLDQSLDALGEFTKYFSAEFAIRDFINSFPKETYIKFQEWSKNDNHHQRRLSSEWLRPKLPWAMWIDFDYKKASEILDNLFYDEERYVTRSVANHLNDISKIDPDFVIERLSAWKKSKKQNTLEMDYIINHSLRTSVKRWHKETLIFLGFNPNPKIEIKDLKIKERNIKLWEFIEFSFDIITRKQENLIIDYKVIYPTKSKRVSQKVFKIKKIELQWAKSILIKKKHPFRKMTTKKLYTWEYKLEIQINWKIFDCAKFYLEA